MNKKAVKQKRQIRDLIYVNGHLGEQFFYSHGMEFHELIAACPVKPELLVLLAHRHDSADWNLHSRMDYVTRENLQQLVEDDVYGYGDFCWVELSGGEETLDALDDAAISELLLFGHLARPLHREVLFRIITRFAYYAHDDGWFNKLYVKALADYQDVLTGVIASKAEAFTGRAWPTLPAEIGSFLLAATGRGLLLDFAGVTPTMDKLSIPAAEIGPYTDMDEVFEVRRNGVQAQFTLECDGAVWRLDSRD